MMRRQEPAKNTTENATVAITKNESAMASAARISL